MDEKRSLDVKAILLSYLLVARDSLLWKLEGLSPYDARRPLTPTGLNILGLNSHVAICAADYFGSVFERPCPEPTPDVDEDPHADFVVPADVSTADAIAQVGRWWAHAEATIEALPLDAVGRVPWWEGERGEATLQQILVHMVAEAHRHAGHADILRETVDGAAGLKPGVTNLPDVEWTEHVARVEETARASH